MSNLRWQDKAACRAVPADMRDRWFFPGTSGRPAPAHAYEYAKQVYCEGCPVREECLDYALANNDKWGLWGGMSPEERWQLGRDPIEHGTIRGYRQHRVANGDPCQPCKDAWTRYIASRAPKDPPPPRTVLRVVIEHGTVAGRNGHRRQGTPLCDECRVAYNAYERNRKKAS